MIGASLAITVYLLFSTQYVYSKPVPEGIDTALAVNNTGTVPFRSFEVTVEDGVELLHQFCPGALLYVITVRSDDGSLMSGPRDANSFVMAAMDVTRPRDQGYRMTKARAAARWVEPRIYPLPTEVNKVSPFRWVGFPIKLRDAWATIEASGFGNQWLMVQFIVLSRQPRAWGPKQPYYAFLRIRPQPRPRPRPSDYLFLGAFRGDIRLIPPHIPPSSNLTFSTGSWAQDDISELAFL